MPGDDNLKEIDDPDFKSLYDYEALANSNIKVMLERHKRNSQNDSNKVFEPLEPQTKSLDNKINLMAPKRGSK